MDDKDLFIKLDSEEIFQNNIETSEEEDIDEEEDIENNKHITLKVIVAIIIITGIIFGITKKIVYKTEEQESEQIIVPSIRYECEQGYELLYNQCEKTITIDANKNYYCSADYQIVDNKCIKYEYTNATKEYEPCPENYTEGYGKCVYEYPVVEPTYDYVCPANTMSKHNTCYMLSHTGSPTKFFDGSNQCLSMGRARWYEIRNNTCYYYLDVGKTKTNPKCPENYFYNNSGCYRIDEFNQKYKYTCPNGYSLDSNNNCTKTSTQAIKVNYWCEDGYILSESKCIKTETIAPKEIYTCPNNYILEYNLCKKIK